MIGLLLYVLNYIVVFASANPIAQVGTSEWDWQQSQWAIKQHFPGGQCRINGAQGNWEPWRENRCAQGVFNFDSIPIAETPGKLDYEGYMCCIKVPCERKKYGHSAFCAMNLRNSNMPQFNKFPDCPTGYKRIPDTEKRCDSKRTDTVFVDGINQYNPIEFRPIPGIEETPHCCAPIDPLKYSSIDEPEEYAAQPQQIVPTADSETAPLDTSATAPQTDLAFLNDETDQGLLNS